MTEPSAIVEPAVFGVEPAPTEGNLPPFPAPALADIPSGWVWWALYQGEPWTYEPARAKFGFAPLGLTWAELFFRFQPPLTFYRGPFRFVSIVPSSRYAGAYWGLLAGPDAGWFDRDARIRIHGSELAWLRSQDQYWSSVASYHPVAASPETASKPAIRWELLPRTDYHTPKIVRRRYWNQALGAYSKGGHDLWTAPGFASVGQDAPTRYYTVLAADGAPLGYALLSPNEAGRFRRFCSFGSYSIRDVQAADPKAIGTRGRWHHVSLGKSRLDRARGGLSAGWWYLPHELARAIAFQCLPAELHDEHGETLYRSL